MRKIQHTTYLFITLHKVGFYPEKNLRTLFIFKVKKVIKSYFYYFRYWLRSTFSLISPVQTESKDYDMDFNIEYLWHDHSNYKLLYHGPNLNTSYIINFERFPDKSGEINVKCHMDSPLKLLNFDYAGMSTL